MCLARCYGIRVQILPFKGSSLKAETLSRGDSLERCQPIGATKDPPFVSEFDYWVRLTSRKPGDRC
jgi:hypothetical protein